MIKFMLKFLVFIEFLIACWYFGSNFVRMINGVDLLPLIVLWQGLFEFFILGILFILFVKIFVWWMLLGE